MAAARQAGIMAGSRWRKRRRLASAAATRLRLSRPRTPQRHKEEHSRHECRAGTGNLQARASWLALQRHAEVPLRVLERTGGPAVTAAARQATSAPTFANDARKSVIAIPSSPWETATSCTVCSCPTLALQSRSGALTSPAQWTCNE